MGQKDLIPRSICSRRQLSNPGHSNDTSKRSACLDYKLWEVMGGTVIGHRERIHTELRHFAHTFVLAPCSHYLKQN